MAYAYHIVRRDVAGERQLIELARLQAAVSSVDGVRMADGDLRLRNPATGEEIVLRNSGGDVEVFDASMGNWVRAFIWSNGRITFRAPVDPDDLVMTTARALALALDATIVGDEGEDVG